MLDATNATLTIGALASRSGCPVPTIRYYEEVGLLHQARRRPNGHRVYSRADQDRLTFIRRSRDFGFSIEQIRGLLAMTEDPRRSCTEARDVAQTHLDAVRLKLKELRALEQGLAALVRTCSDQCLGGAAPGCTIFSELVEVEPKPSPSPSCCA